MQVSLILNVEIIYIELKEKNFSLSESSSVIYILLFYLDIFN